MKQRHSIEDADIASLMTPQEDASGIRDEET
jgi:hypothetical protein